MKTRKLLSLFLAILLAMPVMSACGGETTDEIPTETDMITETEAVETEPSVLPDSLPADLDLQGQSTRVLHFYDTMNLKISCTESTGEILNDTIYATNERIMEALNFKFEFIDNGNIDPINIQTAYEAGDDIYEIIYGTQWRIVPFVTQHMYANLGAAADTYINYDAPWWYKKYIDDTSIHEDYNFFLAGDASPDILNCTSMLLVNTDLLTDIGQSTEDLYETILAGDWTMDRYRELAAQIYVDGNGNGERDEADTYGFTTNSRSYVDHLLFSSGIHATERYSGSVPILTLNNEKTILCIEKVVDLFWNDNGSYYTEGVDLVGKLQNNTILSFPYRFLFLNQLRDVDTAYTIVPLPKLDESMSSYKALVHDDPFIYCIPVISPNVKNSTAILETMGYQYYQNVMPVYYETIIKSKYRRDSSDYAAQMLDIIHDNLTTEFAIFYNYTLSEIATSLRDLIGVKKSADFASVYAANEKKYQANLDSLINVLLGEDS